MRIFTIVTRSGEALFPDCHYDTAKAAKIAASKLGYNKICEVSKYSYSCYNIQQKINGKWQKID